MVANDTFLTKITLWHNIIPSLSSVSPCVVFIDRPAVMSRSLQTEECFSQFFRAKTQSFKTAKAPGSKLNHQMLSDPDHWIGAIKALIIFIRSSDKS